MKAIAAGMPSSACARFEGGRAIRSLKIAAACACVSAWEGAARRAPRNHTAIYGGLCQLCARESSIERQRLAEETARLTGLEAEIQALRRELDPSC